MRKLIVFSHVSLLYFTDANGDMSFAQNAISDLKWDEFVSGNASAGGILEFGTHPLCSINDA